MLPIAFIMGPTCSGKSTFLTYAANVLGKSLHTVEIGKEMRRRHPEPGAFKGMMAVPEMEAEALDIFWQGIKMGLTLKGVGLIAVDGMPRTIETAKALCMWRPLACTKRFFMLHASEEVRLDRLACSARTDKEDQRARIRGDMAGYFEVMMELSYYGEQVESIRTDDPCDPYQSRLLSSLCEV